MTRSRHAALTTGALALAALGATVPVEERAAHAAPPATKDVDRTKVPAGGPAPKLELPRPSRVKLASGAELVVVERHTLPMAAVTIVWPTGGAAEPRGREGMIGVAMELLTEGTKRHTSVELARELEGLGTQLDPFSGWDSSGVGITSLTKNLDRSLDLLAEVLLEPTFDAKELARLVSERRTAIVQQRDAASVVATNVFLRALYGETSRFGQPLIGTTAGLAATTRDDVIRFWQSELRPSRATVLVVGDVKPARVKEQLDRAFAAWKEPPTPAPPLATVPAPTAAPRFVIVDKPGAPQSEVRIGQPGVPRTSPDFFPLVVMNTIFGGQFSSRLNMNLREAHGYTYGARSDMAFRRDGGPFVLSAPVKTDTTAPSLKESLAELERLRAEAVKPEELRLAKDLLERALGRRLETVGHVAGELASIVVYRLPDDYLATYAQHVEAVAPADVSRVATQHLDPSKLTIVVVGDRKVIEPTLAGLHLGPVELRDSEGRVIGPPPPPAAGQQDHAAPQQGTAPDRRGSGTAGGAPPAATQHQR